MAPKAGDLKLSRDAFQGVGGEHGSGAPAAAGPPAKVRLVIGGTAGIGALDKLTLAMKADGVGKEKKTQLAGIAYELNPGEAADAALSKFQVAFETPGNVPVTLVHPLTGAVDPSKIPPPDTPPQFAQVCFALPTITAASDVQGDKEQKWLEVFKIASERRLTLELAISPQEDIREAVEKLLGKAWDHERSAAKEKGEEDSAPDHQPGKGLRIIFDAFASPPLNQDSTQLSRSKELEGWSDFISRLALNPRVYLKLSPLPIPSSFVPAAIATHRRPVDALGSTVPLPGANLAGSTAQAAVDAATNVANAAESTALSTDAQAELQQRLRFFLETALEAFGDQRLVWTSQLSAANSATSLVKSSDGLSEPEVWFEAVLGTLRKIGVDQNAIDNIFSQNVSVVYQM